MNFFDEFDKTNFETWKTEAEKVLKGKPIEKLYSSTLEEIQIKPIYTKEDLPNDLKKEFPGFPYFSRSRKPDGNRLESWKIIQRIEFPLPKIANQIIKNEIDKGVNGFLIKHFNYDFENPKGVIIDSLLDLEDILDGIDLTKISLHFDTLFPLELSSLLAQYLDKHSFSNLTLDGSINLDIHECLLNNGKFFEQTYWLNKSLFQNFQILKDKLPNFKTFVVDGTIFFESGSNTVQEIAFSLNLAVEILKSLINQDTEIQNVLSKFMFRLSIGSDIFINLAKLRSIRILWATILQSLGIDSKTWWAPIYAATTKRNKSKLDVYVNMLRNTCETFSAILGSADYIEVIPYDYFLSEPEEFSFRNARNSQLVLKEEHNLREVVDPAGGSWFLESLTFELTKKAFELFKEIERNGGFYTNLINGEIQKQIFEQRNKRLQRLATREDILVGTNRFPNPEDKLEFEKKIFDYKNYFKERPSIIINNPSIVENQSSNRNELSEFAKNYDNSNAISPFESIKKYLIEIKPLEIFRETEEFENLKKKSLIFKNKFGSLPQVGIIPFGKIADFKERLDFVVDFFLLGGFDVRTFDETKSIEEAFQKFFEIQPQIVVFCSTNEQYPEFAAQLATLIKKAKPLTIVVLTGLPSEKELDTFKQNGVDVFIHLKSDVLKTLNNLYAMITIE